MRRCVVRLPAVMAQLLLLSLLVFSIQRLSGQVVVSSSSSNEPAPVPPPVPPQASPTVTVYSTEVSPATSSPLGGNDAPVSDPPDVLAALDGSVGHRGSDGHFGDGRGGEEEVTDVEGRAALPEKETQVQGNANISDPQATEETSQDVKAFVSSSPAYPTPKWGVPITTTTPSLLHPASSISGMDQTPSATTAGLPVTVSTVTPDHKQRNTTQEATSSPLTNTSSDHTRSPNFTVREEAGTSGQATQRPDGKTEEEHQQLGGSSDWPVPTVARTENSTVTMTTPGERQTSVQSQGQTQSDPDSAIMTKAPTSPTPTQVLQPLPSTPSPSTRSADLQSTTYTVTGNGTLTQTTANVHRAGKGADSGTDAYTLICQKLTFKAYIGRSLELFV